MIRIFVSKLNSKISSDEYIKQIGMKFLGIQEEHLIINRTRYGKPFLAKFPNIYYNISHTKGLIVCGIADSLIGIDVEITRFIRLGVVDRCFCPSEREYILACAEVQDARFTEVWTKKEAYVKWLGKGMIIPFDSFDVFKDLSSKLVSISYGDYYISVCNDCLMHMKMSDIKIDNIELD